MGTRIKLDCMGVAMVHLLVTEIGRPGYGRNETGKTVNVEMC